MKLTKELVVYLPDTRNVVISRYGKGNTKIGWNVYTYSRPAGSALPGTCPGATEECERICYAKRITGGVLDNYYNNVGTDVPPIPDDCSMLRLHVSGDFDSIEYILSWVRRLQERPDVTMWAYTRSWRVPELREALEVLRALPNVQLFASMDISTQELPPSGWRRAWINGDPRECSGGMISENYNATTFDGQSSYLCPEQDGRKQTCERCRYCFDGKTRDVTFMQH